MADEDLIEIKESVQKENLINFFKTHKNKFILFFALLLLLGGSYFVFNKYNESKKEKVAASYFYGSMLLENKRNDDAKKVFKSIILESKSPYAILSLYQIIKLESDLKKIESFFDIIIKRYDGQEELRDLLIYKKNLLLSESIDENQLLLSMNQIINNKGMWKSHALLFLGDYYFAKKKFDKSKEFYQRILDEDSQNAIIKREAELRLKKLINVQN